MNNREILIHALAQADISWERRVNEYHAAKRALTSAWDNQIPAGQYYMLQHQVELLEARLNGTENVIDRLEKNLAATYA